MVGPPETPDLLSRVAAAAANAVSNIPVLQSRDRTPDPNAALLNLVIPAETGLLSKITKCLSDVGVFCEVAEIADEVQEIRKLHRMSVNGSKPFYLVWIPKWILDDPNTQNKAAINLLVYTFPSGARVFVISERVDVFKLSYGQLFATWSVRHKIGVELIAWNNLLDLVADGLPATQQQRDTKLLFKLDALGNSVAQDLKLVANERLRLIDIMVSQAVHAPLNVGERGYLKNLLLLTQLPDNFKHERGGALTGSAVFDVPALIDWAISKGTNPQRRSHSVLAELIENMFTGADLQENNFLVNLVVDKRLIFESSALDEFRAIARRATQ